jgi:uncharacterized protein
MNSRLNVRLPFNPEEIPVRFITAVSLFFSLAMPAHAGFDEGFTAYSAGDYTSALGEFRPLAEQGVAAAQTILGDMYQHGQGVEQDNKEAVKWYLMAAEQGFVYGQTRLADMYSNGLGVPRYDKGAVKWFLMAAGQGNVYAQGRLSGMYYNGQGVPQSSVVAYALINLAAIDRSYTEAQRGREGLAENMSAAEVNAGQALSREMFKPGNFTVALQQLRPMEEPARADAELHLKQLHIGGYGAAQDNQEAANLLTQAAHPDNVDARYNLGRAYAMGIGVPQDYQMAAMWLRLIAEQGDDGGQLATGLMYAYGMGVSKDFKEALIWFTRAAEQGNAQAMQSLGDMYSKRYPKRFGGIMPDYWQAAEWYRKAALKGHKSSFAWHEIDLAPAVWKQSCEKPDRPLSCSIVYRSTFQMPDSFDNPDYKPDNESPLAFSLWAGFDKDRGDFLVTLNMDQSPLSPAQKVEEYNHVDDWGHGYPMVSFKTGPEVDSTGWCVFKGPSRYFPRGNMHCRFSHPARDFAESIANPDNWNEDDTLSFAFSVLDTTIFSFSVPVNEELFKPRFESTILDAHRRENERLKVATQIERDMEIERIERGIAYRARREAAERRAERKEDEHWDRVLAEADKRYRRQSNEFWGNFVETLSPQQNSGGGYSSGGATTSPAPLPGFPNGYSGLPTGYSDHKEVACSMPEFKGYEIGEGNGKHGVAIPLTDNSYVEDDCRLRPKRPDRGPAEGKEQ